MLIWGSRSSSTRPLPIIDESSVRRNHIGEVPAARCNWSHVTTNGDVHGRFILFEAVKSLN
jgi:hypothetical protein